MKCHSFALLPIMALALLVTMGGPLQPVWAEEENPQPKAYGSSANDLPLSTYKELRVLWEAATGLFDFKSPAAAQLPEGVKSKDTAKSALTKVVGEKRDQLIRALNASQALHRELAAKLLPHGGEDKTVIEALAKALPHEPDSSVRMACTTGLCETKNAAAVDPLVKALRDEHEPVRAQAALGLGETKDPRAVAPLLETLQGDDKSSVRRRAANALKEIKDARALEGLMKALDDEKDYRVRMAIAGAVRAIRGGNDTVATEDVMKPGEDEDVLGGLAKEMRGVEEKLRGDRHDQAVQVDQKKIEQQLTQLIKKVEQMQQKQSQGQGKGKGKKKGQQQKPGGSKGSQAQAGQKRPGSPMADSTVGGSATRGALNPAEVAGRQADWAKLPPSMRDEMLQVYREGMPERWRRRLEAYFLSVAAEEVK